MKSRDIVAFIILYLSSLAVLGFVIYFWYARFGWEGIEILGVIVGVLAIFLGYLFAKYALSPLVERNEELDRLLKETLHELNIPVATIRANVQMLKKGMDEKGLKRLRRVEEATKQLLSLYKEVDYLIKREIDRVEPQELELDRVIEDRMEFLSHLTRHHKVELSLEPTQIQMQKEAFFKLFDNLISNAVKYSPPSSTIKITLRQRELTIEDEGEGIESSELVRIFDRYYRANEKKPGQGIGLAIVKQICDENGIEIHIDSKKGSGTRVRLDLTKI